MHCHMTHHMMNQMGDNFPNMIGVNTEGLDKNFRQFIPGYMTMGTAGMASMTGMPVPKNSIPMRGGQGQFGSITMGGMVTVFKVRAGITTYEDPGWYQHPTGTLAGPASPEELKRDGLSRSP